MSERNSIYFPDLALILVVSLLSFLPFLGAAPLFDWDEINFAEAAREMLVTGDYFRVRINYEVFWEKPPLFFWLQVISMKIFGINAFAARLPNALVGVVTLLSLYVIGTRLRDRIFGLLVAGFYFCSLLPHFYFKSGIIDPLFNLFIFLGIIQLLQAEMRSEREGKRKHLDFALAGLFLGLATLTKGPVGLLVPGLVWLTYKLLYGWFPFPWRSLLVGVVVGLLVILTWFGSMLVFTAEGPALIMKFIEYQLSLASSPVGNHGQPFFYHPLVFLIGCFPLAVFALRGMTLRFSTSRDRALKRMMLVFFWVVMILFSLITNKIIHYSSLTYFPGAFLAALFFYEILKGRKKFTPDMGLHFVLSVALLGGATLGINYLASHLQNWAPQVENPYVKGAMQLSVSWSGWEFIWGLIFLLGTLGGLILILKKKWLAFLALQCLVTMIFMNGLNKTVAPKVAEYSQKTATDFYREMKDKDAYFLVAGFKSYAQYYYAEVMPEDRREMPEEEWRTWLIRGNVDKDVYMVARKDAISWRFFQWHRYFIPMYEKGGFVFLLRKK
ncbi:MAG: glycosyltransferase family 39 protein [Bacteroidia bacterium]|nr:glycosyltransferase family 39 protein [Bacteroidia bacterium]